MIKSRIPVLPKSKKIPENKGVEIKEREKKTCLESAVVINKVLCERKMQGKPVGSKNAVCQPQVYSQIPGKRHFKPNIRAGTKVKYGTSLKVNSKSLPSKATCPNAVQRSILKPENVVYKGGDQKPKKKFKFSNKESEEGYHPKLCEKENLPEDKCELPPSAQQKEEEKFETNKAFRQALLSGRDVSPSILKMTSGAKSSLSINRPSLYKSLIVSADPYKTALKAIEDAKFANSRPSLVRKASLFSTPMKSLFLAGDPSKEALKSLELLRTKKMMKSHKKVTFKFQEDNALCDSGKHPNEEIRAEKESESRLTDISERDETSQNSSRENSRKLSVVTEELRALNMKLLRSELSAIKTSDHSNSLEVNCLNHHFKSFQCIDSQNLSKENKSEFVSDKDFACCVKEHFDTSNHCSSNSTIFSDRPNKSASVKDSKTMCDINNHDPEVKRLLPEDGGVSDSLKYSLMYLQQNLSLNKNSNVKAPEEGLVPKSSMYKTENRIFTPCPISYKPQPSIMNSGSPEFLAEKVNKTVAHDVPICTPLVLKRLAKEYEVEDEAITPIRLKLDFNNVDLNSKKEETPMFMQGPEKNNTCTGILLRDIPTARKVLDLLADEECSVILLKQKASTACGRYMKNPLEVILSEGDEKHFIPIGSPQK